MGHEAIYRPRRARRNAKIEGLELELVAVKDVVKLQTQHLSSLLDLNKKLIERLAGLGLKVVFKGGELQFEAVTQTIPETIA